MNEFEIPYFDLVIVDLYPFEATVASGAPEQDIIEKIDIGGISLIRAAAKNFKDCWIISNMGQYEDALAVLSSEEGATLEIRRRYALRRLTKVAITTPPFTVTSLVIVWILK